MYAVWPCAVYGEVTDLPDDRATSIRKKFLRGKFAFRQRVLAESGDYVRGGNPVKKVYVDASEVPSLAIVVSARALAARRRRLQPEQPEPATQPSAEPENPENVSPTPPTLDTPGTPAHTPGRYLGYIRVLYCTVPALHSPSVTFSHL